MRRIIMLLILMVSIQVVRPMSMTRVDEKTVQLYGISRVLPQEFRMFLCGIENRLWFPTRRPLLFTTIDSFDAKNVAQALAAKYDLVFMCVNCARDIFLEKKICYEEYFKQAKKLALIQNKKVLLFFQNAEGLVDSAMVKRLKLDTHSLSFSEALQKHLNNDFDIAVLVHAEEVDRIVSWLCEEFEGKTELSRPEQKELKMLFQAVFSNNNIAIDRELLDSMVCYIKGKTWREVYSLAEGFAEIAKIKKSNMTADIIRSYLHDFSTPEERRKRCLSIVTEKGYQLLKYGYPWIGLAALCCVLFKSVKNLKKRKAVNVSNSDMLENTKKGILNETC